MGITWGIQGDPTGDPMGISWTYNGCPPWEYHGDPIENQWEPIWEWHGDPMGIAMDPQLEIQGAQRVAKGEPTWNPMGIKWAPKDPNADMYVQPTGNPIMMACTQHRRPVGN